MDQILVYMKLVIQLLPLIVQAVQAVEAAVPVAGAGQQKLEMVKSVVQNAINTASQIGPTFEQLWPAISAVVASLVAAFNASGAFRKN